MPFLLTIRERNHSWAGRPPRSTTHPTQAEADAALLEYVQRNWESEVGTELPANAGLLINEYFDEVLEAYDITEYA
jgi:hypothetical protein